jgi:hypothetical protein
MCCGSPVALDSFHNKKGPPDGGLFLFPRGTIKHYCKVVELEVDGAGEVFCLPINPGVEPSTQVPSTFESTSFPDASWQCGSF